MLLLMLYLIELRGMCPLVIFSMVCHAGCRFTADVSDGVTRMLFLVLAPLGRFNFFKGGAGVESTGLKGHCLRSGHTVDWVQGGSSPGTFESYEFG